MSFDAVCAALHSLSLLQSVFANPDALLELYRQLVYYEWDGKRTRKVKSLNWNYKTAYMAGVHDKPVFICWEALMHVLWLNHLDGTPDISDEQLVELHTLAQQLRLGDMLRLQPTGERALSPNDRLFQPFVPNTVRANHADAQKRYKGWWDDQRAREREASQQQEESARAAPPS